MSFVTFSAVASATPIDDGVTIQLTVTPSETLLQSSLAAAYTIGNVVLEVANRTGFRAGGYLIINAEIVQILDVDDTVNTNGFYEVLINASLSASLPVAEPIDVAPEVLVSGVTRAALTNKIGSDYIFDHTTLVLDTGGMVIAGTDDDELLFGVSVLTSVFTVNGVSGAVGAGLFPFGTSPFGSSPSVYGLDLLGVGDVTVERAYEGIQNLISWNNPNNATTFIYRKVGGYPTDFGDGELVMTTTDDHYADLRVQNFVDWFDLRFIVTDGGDPYQIKIRHALPYPTLTEDTVNRVITIDVLWATTTTGDIASLVVPSGNVSIVGGLTNSFALPSVPLGSFMAELETADTEVLENCVVYYYAVFTNFSGVYSERGRGKVLAIDTQGMSELMYAKFTDWDRAGDRTTPDIRYSRQVDATTGEIYHDEDTENTYHQLNRFIKLFSHQFADAKGLIDFFCKFYDPYVTDIDMIPRLMATIGLDDNAAWSDEERRFFLQSAASGYGQDGNFETVEAALNSVFGNRPYTLKKYAPNILVSNSMDTVSIDIDNLSVNDDFGGNPALADVGTVADTSSFVTSLVPSHIVTHKGFAIWVDFPLAQLSDNDRARLNALLSGLLSSTNSYELLEVGTDNIIADNEVN